ncbi:MAG: hypothetical protein IJ087_22200 [Eggerthellaceae bacterium]|nr:hypothetical protein [Eggerthellaceae bacterium]
MSGYGGQLVQVAVVLRFLGDVRLGFRGRLPGVGEGFGAASIPVFFDNLFDLFDDFGSICLEPMARISKISSSASMSSALT